ncbi:MAG: hypothetical protein RL375_3280 [Pseudomonadota bacterium]
MIQSLAYLRRTGEHKARLAFQFTGLLLLISVMPLLIFYLTSYRTTENTVVELAAQQNRQILSNQKDYLSLQLDQIEALAANLSQIEEISSTLERSNTQTGESIYDTLATKARMGYLLSNYSNLSGLVSIDIFTLGGKHYHVGDSLVDGGEREALRDALWERTIKSPGQISWHGVEDNVQTTSTSQKVVSASRMLLSTTSSWLKSEPIAMLLINYSTDYLHDHFSKVNLGQGAFMLVVDQQHRLIYHPDKAKIGWQVAPEFAELLQDGGGSSIRQLGHTEVLFSFEKIPGKDWHIISVTPMATLLAPMSELRRVAGIILLLMVVVILAFLRLFTSRVVKPIEDIASGFKQFQANRITAGWRMPHPRSLEAIKDLTKWFNIFLDHMERRRESEVRLRIAATAFESHDAMLVADAGYVLLQANRALSVMTGYEESELIGKNVDILLASPQDSELFADIRRTVEASGAWQGEVLNRRHNGQQYPAWLTISGVRNDDHVLTHLVATITDITQRKANEEEIRNLAFHDALTGLANRRMLNDRLIQAMHNCQRRMQSLALILLDLDKFKAINDTLGHDAGDLLLKQVAQRITSCVREVDTVARLGGDEFVVLIEGLSSELAEAASDAESVARKIIAAVAQSYEELGATNDYCSASIGITQFSPPGCDLDELMKQADIALYQAKAAGRNTLRFFDPNMQRKIVERAHLEHSLRLGLSRGEFILHFQPKVDADRRPLGAEVLVRWHHPELGLLFPAAFIGLAEDAGLITRIGQLVFRAACAQLREWASQPDRRHLTLSVNVSPKEIGQADFVSNVLAIVDESGADARKLTVEITENLLIENMKETVDKMIELNRRGINFSLDDFGTGYSSLGYLKRMPLGELKIDRSFVRDVLCDSNDAAIVRIVIALGHELGLDVVAEGIETQEQFDFLAAHGCRMFQGYHFGMPVPLPDFHRFLDATPGIAAPGGQADGQPKV